MCDILAATQAPRHRPIHIFLAARDIQRGMDAVNQVKEMCNENNSVKFVQLDVSDPASIAKAVECDATCRCFGCID